MAEWITKQDPADKRLTSDGNTQTESKQIEKHFMEKDTKQTKS